MATKENATLIAEQTLISAIATATFMYYFGNYNIIDSFRHGIVTGTGMASFSIGLLTAATLLEPKSKYIDERAKADN